MSKAQEFLKEFELSLGNLHEACKKTGLTREQIISFSKTNPKFAQRLWESYEGIIDLAESTLLKLGMYNQDSGALKTYLSAKAKNRGYGSTEINNKIILPGINQPEEKNPQIEYRKKISNWSTEQIENKLNKMKKIKL